MKSVTGTQRRSSLFLIELMISIFFFAIASSVCIQLFAEARRITEETTAENQALLQAQSAASVFYAGGGTLQLFPESFPGADTAGGTWAAVFFDGNWKNCEKGTGAVRQMTVSVSGSSDGTFSDADISVRDMEKDTKLCELHVRYHAPDENSHISER